MGSADGESPGAVVDATGGEADIVFTNRPGHLGNGKQQILQLVRVHGNQHLLVRPANDRDLEDAWNPFDGRQD